MGEIAGLKWSDIDWENSTISIARSWVAGNVEDTKTEGSAKPLPMDRDLASNAARSFALSELPTRQAAVQSITRGCITEGISSSS